MYEKEIKRGRIIMKHTKTNTKCPKERYSVKYYNWDKGHTDQLGYWNTKKEVTKEKKELVEYLGIPKGEEGRILIIKEPNPHFKECNKRK